MVKTTVYLDEAVAFKLKRMAEAQQRPQAVLIREGLAQYADSYSPKLPGGLGQFSSGQSKNAATYRSKLAKAMREGKWK